jgi:hypothetical protein
MCTKNPTHNVKQKWGRTVTNTQLELEVSINLPFSLNIDKYNEQNKENRDNKSKLNANRLDFCTS